MERRDTSNHFDVESFSMSDLHNEETASTASGDLAQTLYNTTEDNINYVDKDASNPFMRSVGVAAVVVIPQLNIPSTNVNNEALAALNNKDKSILASPLELNMEATPIIEQGPVEPTPASSTEVAYASENTTKSVGDLTYEKILEVIDQSNLDANEREAILNYAQEVDNAAKFISSISLGLPIETADATIAARFFVITMADGSNALVGIPVNISDSSVVNPISGGEYKPGSMIFSLNGNLYGIPIPGGDSHISFLGSTNADEAFAAVYTGGVPTEIIGWDPSVNAPKPVSIQDLISGGSQAQGIETLTFSSEVVTSEFAQKIDAGSLPAETSQSPELEATITPPNGVDIALFVYDPDTDTYKVDRRLSGTSLTVNPLYRTDDGKIAFEVNGQILYVSGHNTSLTADQVSALPIKDLKTGTVESIIDSYNYLSPNAQVSIENVGGRDVLVIDGVSYQTRQLEIDNRQIESGIYETPIVGRNEKIYNTVGYVVGFEKSNDEFDVIDQNGIPQHTIIDAYLIIELKWSDGTSVKKGVPIPRGGVSALRDSSGRYATGASLSTMLEKLQIGDEVKIEGVSMTPEMMNSADQYRRGLVATGEMSEATYAATVAGLQPNYNVSLSQPGREMQIYKSYSQRELNPQMIWGSAPGVIVLPHS